MVAMFGPARLKPGWLLVSLLICLAAQAANAASICGVVTDAVSGNPVDRAGVFLRTQAGDYTGDHTATAPDGSYCLDGLFAGTYTLEVRVDNYVVHYQTNVVVADDISDVPIAANLPAVRLVAPWPNPAAGATKMRVIVQRTAAVQLGVYDARGRLLRSWGAAALDPGSHDYQWDGRGRDGRQAPSGIYFIQVRSEDQISTRPLVLAR